MADEKVLRRIGEAVDRMIMVDVSARGLIRTLYDGARATLENKPLALATSQNLRCDAAPGIDPQTRLVATRLSDDSALLARRTRPAGPHAPVPEVRST